VTRVIENERWRIADKAANFLSIDRDACRKAFHQESEERVREVIQWVISERNLPEHDPERMIEHWAREHGAGVYGEDRRRGSLEHVERIVTQAIFGRDAAA
jgi:hypothetical protein